jgi:hypothetical protein
MNGPLNEHERHELDEIVRHLSEDDPRLARALTGPPPRRRQPEVLLGWSLLWLGVLFLVLGAALSDATLFLCGILCVVTFPVPLRLAAERREGR